MEQGLAKLERQGVAPKPERAWPLCSPPDSRPRKPCFSTPLGTALRGSPVAGETVGRLGALHKPSPPEGLPSDSPTLQRPHVAEELGVHPPPQLLRGLTPPPVPLGSLPPADTVPQALHAKRRANTNTCAHSYSAPLHTHTGPHVGTRTPSEDAGTCTQHPTTTQRLRVADVRTCAQSALPRDAPPRNCTRGLYLKHFPGSSAENKFLFTLSRFVILNLVPTSSEQTTPKKDLEARKGNECRRGRC